VLAADKDADRAVHGALLAELGRLGIFLHGVELQSDDGHIMEAVMDIETHTRLLPSQP